MVVSLLDSASIYLGFMSHDSTMSGFFEYLVTSERSIEALHLVHVEHFVQGLKEEMSLL